uniref:Uncharacterized protein n=1 Tax=Panagrolaimus sp. ES5 TaxID=591445 RepID=A0AC34GVU6_9BILA
MIASINLPSTNENPMNYGTMQNSIIPSIADVQLGNPQSLQPNALSPQSLSLLIEALKTFCNSNLGNGNASIANIPPLSFPITSSTQGTVAVNQVSPAPSDPIPPIQSAPPKNYNMLNNNLNRSFITCGSTPIVTKTQEIFSYPAATNTVCGSTQLCGLGNNFNQLINENQTFVAAPCITSSCSGVTNLNTLSDEPSTSYSQNIIEPEDNNYAISSINEESNSPATPSLHDFQDHRYNESFQEVHGTEIQSHETANDSQDEVNDEFDQLEQQEINEMGVNIDKQDDSSNSEFSTLTSKVNETIAEKDGPSASKKHVADELIEVEDFEPKVECHVPLEVLNSLPEIPKIAPLKINLKLLQASHPTFQQPKPIKRKSSHKSRKSYKEDDDTDSDNDNEYKSRIKTEDFDSIDTCFTDPLALRKIQRKTSSQIKQEQESFIERIYNQPDDEKKLKVIYPNVQAEVFYNPGDYITKFVGDIITSRTVYNQNKDNPFLIEIGRNKWIDGKDRRSFGVYILPAEVPHRANTTIKVKVQEYIK